MEYFFDISKCQACPYRDGCYKPSLIEKHNDSHKEFKETEYFKETIKQRYKTEA